MNYLYLIKGKTNIELRNMQIVRRLIELGVDHFDRLWGKNREIKFRGRLGREVEPFVTFTVVEVSRALTACRFNCCVLVQDTNKTISFFFACPLVYLVYLTFSFLSFPFCHATMTDKIVKVKKKLDS